MKVTLLGYGDDLIKLEGDIARRWALSDKDDLPFVAFGDGTVLLRISISANGIWRIAPVVRGTAELSIEQDDHTDRATLTGDIRWAVLGAEIAKAKETKT
jgi:hypothetical protein